MLCLSYILLTECQSLQPETLACLPQGMQATAMPPLLAACGGMCPHCPPGLGLSVALHMDHIC